MLRPPADLEYSILRSFPAAQTPGERFALLDALFADLHASSERIWIGLLSHPTTSEVRVILGSEAPTSAGAGWAGPEDEPLISVEDLDRLCDATGTGSLLRPVLLSEPDFLPAPGQSPETMAQLRLLEQARRPIDVSMVLFARRASVERAEDEVSRLLRKTSAGLANQSRSAGLDEWTEHHRALAGLAELARGGIGGLWEIKVELSARRSGAVGRAIASINESLRLSVPFGLVSDHVEDRSDPVLVTNRFLSCLGLPPYGEVPGFRSIPIWFFDQTQERSSDLSSTPIGTVLTPTGDCGSDFVITEQNLVRHTLVTGATGSGKTETVKRLVNGIGETFELPWLIIEPAKSEYRHLRFGPGGSQAPLVIRPGYPKTPPIRFNPFEPEPDFPLRTHVDLVHALFLAAFEPVDPLPQILAASIEHAYRAAGWLVPVDLLEGATSAPDAEDYPSLDDLQRSADEVIDKIGYAGETLGNVRGFVNVRLRSLRLGTAGGMLERGNPVDFSALMKERVVIELDDIGNDQEKSFLMGVILVRLYEHLRVLIEKHSKQGNSSRQLSHVTIVEEAHRLLRAALPGEKPNFAVESFSNMLAELRSYGEGLVIVEQVPSKIVSDAVKNTGTKILHRLPSMDDREFAGLAANVEPDQLMALGALPPGQALCFTDEMDRPCRVAVARMVSEPGSDPPVRANLKKLMVHRSTEGRAHESAWSLGELVLASREVERAPGLSFWIEVAFYYASEGWLPYRPSPRLVAEYGTLSECARVALLNAALEPRRVALRSVAGADDIRRVLGATLTSAFSGAGPKLIQVSDIIGDAIMPQGQRGRADIAWGVGNERRAAVLVRGLRDSGAVSSMAELMEYVVDETINALEPSLDQLFI